MTKSCYSVPPVSPGPFGSAHVYICVSSKGSVTHTCSAFQAVQSDNQHPISDFLLQQIQIEEARKEISQQVTWKELGDCKGKIKGLIERDMLRHHKRLSMITRPSLLSCSLSPSFPLPPLYRPLPGWKNILYFVTLSCSACDGRALIPTAK